MRMTAVSAGCCPGEGPVIRGHPCLTVMVSTNAGVGSCSVTVGANGPMGARVVVLGCRDRTVVVGLSRTWNVAGVKAG